MGRKKKVENIWKNRITGSGTKPAKDFILNPLNPKTHPEIQRLAVSAILKEIGWVTGVIENVRTGYLVDGEARVLQSLSENENELIPFTQVDLSVEEERKILALFDHIGSLAITETDKFHELLSMIEFESEVLGKITEDLQAVGNLNLDDFFETETIELPPERFSILIEFEDKEEFEAVSGKLKEIAATNKAALKVLLEL